VQYTNTCNDKNNIRQYKIYEYAIIYIKRVLAIESLDYRRLMYFYGLKSLTLGLSTPQGFLRYPGIYIHDKNDYVPLVIQDKAF